MSSKKREERKQRSEAHKADLERAARQRKWRSRAFFVVGVAVVIAAAVMFTTRRTDGEESNGRVWSAAHGHWHEK